MDKTVTIYSTPVCHYCQAAKTFFGENNVAYEDVNVAEDAEKRQEMMSRAHGRHTVPQIFIDGTHVGGCDDLYALERSGKLDPLLAA